ncbi:MAG TPA: leucyl aminopeptidase family protein [Candidatus Paceibacterota bacterium]
MDMRIITKERVGKEYKKADFKDVKNLRQLILALRKVVADAKKVKIKKVAIVLKDLPAQAGIPKLSSLGISEQELGEIIAREVLLADYEFTKYLSKPKEGWSFITELVLVGKVSKELKAGLERGKIIAGSVNMTRELANTPGGEMVPKTLALAAREAVKGTEAKVTVLGRREMEKLGMGAVLGVARGSSHEPQFIVVEYWGAGPASHKATQGDQNNRPIVLIGKGVTFDTGGLNIKTENHMYTMHLDMSGGAAVIHAVALAARLGVKKNVIALVPAVENMPGGDSYRPGDVLRSMSGKSIEILNTDAEGRVILADALTYAKQYNPKLVVDVATLTGAACVALGERASAIFTRDEELEKLTRQLGEKSGDYVWPMPLWEEYESEVKGTFGDVANLGKKGRIGGAIAGAVFLLQFTKDYPKGTKWMHIDMAPTMTATDDEYLGKGAKGTPVKLLLALIEQVS